MWTFGRGAFLLFLTTLGCATRRESTEQSTPTAGAAPVRWQTAGHLLDVQLAERADRPFLVRDRASNVGAQIALRGALAGHARPGDRAVTFERALGGVHEVVQRVIDTGLEDTVRFATKPTSNSVEYELTLDDGVAGLRLVSNIVELLDGKGVPRVRMAPPWIESDRDHLRRDVEVEVRGCAVDRDPHVPWERAPVAPGARTCTVRLTWGDDVSYPALLDPSWTTTGSLATGHYKGLTTRLSNGNVLVAGGCSGVTTGGGTVTAAAEIYGATTGVFTATGSLKNKRVNGSGDALPGGKAVFAGGVGTPGPLCWINGQTPLSTWEVFDGATWTSYSGSGARAVGRISRLPTGALLLAGGTATSTTTAINDVQKYDPTANTFTAVASMATPRRDQSQVTLSSGKVLVAGGINASGTVVSSAELYDPVANTWTATAAMPETRSDAAMLAMPDGTALLAGGRKDDSPTSPGYAGTVIRWTSGAWSTVGTMVKARENLGALVLPSGDAIFVGGSALASGTWSTQNQVDLVTTTNKVETYPNISVSRAGPEVVAFGAASDGVLVLAGVNQPAGTVLSVQKAGAGAAIGTTCTTDSTCAINAICSAGKCTLVTTDAGVDAPADTTTDTADTATTDTATTDTAVADTATTDTAETGAALGASCTAGSACASGFCVDGVCCDGACSSPCLACSAALKESGTASGTCDVAKSGVVDPRGLCVASGECGTTTSCDGLGGCAMRAAGTTCTGGSCDGAGSCVAADAGTDATVTDTGTDTGSSIDAGADVPFTPIDPSEKPTVGSGLATACKSASECGSGNCVEGVCCDRACDGACESCTLPTSPGKCALVPLGLDPKSACSAIPCVRTCGGNGSCIAAFVGAECSRSHCTSPNAGEGPTVCSAVGGACPAAVPFDCGDYACAPAFGACLRDCRSTTDCAPGRICDVASSRCVPAPADEDDGSCAVSGAPSRSMAAGVLLLALASVLRRRKDAQTGR